MYPKLQTNRDLYLAIEDLSKQYSNCGRSLETYLLAVLNRSGEFSERESLTLAEFYELIVCGFTYKPAEFDDVWRAQYDELPHEDDGYAGWYATVVRQIVDLREMDECGTLENELRYFGVSAPRNSPWYNFDPLGYLECAMAGSFGGWEPGDDTGRQYVPGQVGVLAEDGSIQSANPEDLPNPTFEMPTVTWDHFKDFLFCGQIYE
ncbi:hypothetical protein [Gimesia fumaroli]|uniref:Uncharacterized protein n=1 Tax=Gimesia fumaroli TaxID=2527976 RepID=A0A518IF39_9PLAN|nr:hypothetical protein [Gimesia fumaroli]QDV51705.1 hypothetical protein Enr17x_37630 [Gimesia fumaroli]